VGKMTDFEDRLTTLLFRPPAKDPAVDLRRRAGGNRKITNSLSNICSDMSDLWSLGKRSRDTHA
jgi:hypothetical protein